jgi:hypothetical protein
VPNDTEKPKSSDKEFISIIYNKKNDSPKYFELRKSKILFFVIGLPTITLIALVLGVIGLIHTSPFHLIDTYKQNSLAREAISKTSALQNQVQKGEEERASLQKKLVESEEQLKSAQNNGLGTTKDKNGDEVVCPPSSSVTSIGLSTLSFFKPIQGQRDRTRPATLSLSGFKLIANRDTTNLQFNIIPAALGEGKLAGHIIVLMKNELGIEAYPTGALSGPGVQINYASGEPFSTQRFRPVDASFLKPRKSGNYIFTIYIFAKNGDLLHYQSAIMPVRL